MNFSISHMEPSCLILLYTFSRCSADYRDSQNLRALEIHQFKDLILQKGKLRPREGMQWSYSTLVVFFMQSKSFEDGSHAPLTFLMHVPPPCTPVCTCTQSWTQYSAQINKNNCLLSDSDWVSVISSVIEPYVVQFLDEITEVQRGEVDCPRSRNKEMVKAGLEL